VHQPSAEFGVYVHVPFCARRCDYCAFATWTDRSHLVDRYLDACRAQVEAVVDSGCAVATSVFVGGGTPSLVPPDALATVLGAMPAVDGAEITVECNPDTVTSSLLETYRAAGVTRISLGVQSMVPRVLQSLGRTHDIDNVRRSVALVRAAGFGTFNLDLIYGAAGESIDDWARTLDAVFDLDPPHVSAYALTVERGTPLALDAARHPDDDDQATKYLMLHERLAAAGLRWYEISNFARPGHECRHNLLYWRQGNYEGIGCAAHSHRDGRRWWNVRTPERYIDLITEGRSPEAAFETLDVETRELERLQLALRTRDGVPADALPLDDEVIAALVDVHDGRAVLTVEGRLLANEVALRLQSPRSDDGQHHHLVHEQQIRIRQVVGVDDLSPVGRDLALGEVVAAGDVAEVVGGDAP
jgi:oxygen-independent coproporphyrinogen-3 oxidase